MSVHLSEREESKFEVFACADQIGDAILELERKNLGLGTDGRVERLVRNRYPFSERDRAFYRNELVENKKKLSEQVTLLKANLRGAYTIYPTSMAEYDAKRNYQDFAIVNCECLKKILQDSVNLFQVNVNLYEKTIKLINREIGLVKSWRQSGNRLKQQLQG